MAFLPDRLQVNAWSGATAAGAPAATALNWLARDRLLKSSTPLLPERLDENNWADSRVGWGLILPEPAGDHGVPDVELATADDQPEPIRRLVRHRTAGGQPPPIFRFKPDDPDRFTTLRNYATGLFPDISGAPQGTGEASIPLYLLIYATPAQIPWALQSVLNTRFCVGRLDLREDEGLDHYVDALTSTDWLGSSIDVLRTIVWATYHNDEDITALMRNSIADSISSAYLADKDLKAGHAFIDGKSSAATFDRIREALDPGTSHQRGPGVIVTTSHGLTDPALTPDQQRVAIGLPVDSNGARFDVDRLLGGAWQPDGAIWYAHACCSAGSNDLSVFDGLVAPTTDIAKVLKTVTDFTKAAGACVSPLPRRLLGAAKPLRAFVGHVEPTFDWTLRNQISGQYLTDDLRHAFYQALYEGSTVGRALRRWYSRMGALNSQYEQYRPRIGPDVGGELLYYQLAQRDVQTLMILGDPSVRLPLA